MSVRLDTENRFAYLSGGDVSYVLYRDAENRLLNLYWGPRVPDFSLCFDPSDYMPGASFDLPVSLLPYEIPPCSRGWYGFPSVSVRQAAGDDVLDPRVISWAVSPGKPVLPGLPATYAESPEEAETLTVLLEDSFTGLRIRALYSVFASSGAVTRSLSVENASSEACTLIGLLSASVPFWSDRFDVLHLKGAWAREREVVRTPLGNGDYRIASQRGASGHADNPFLAFCDPNASESSGGVWGVSLVYSGSFAASGSVDNAGHARLSIGLNPDVFSWQLDPGAVFTGPEAVMVYSSPDAYCDGVRPVYWWKTLVK